MNTNVYITIAVALVVAIIAVICKFLLFGIKQKRSTIRRKLICLFLSISIPPILSIGLISFYQGKTVTEERIYAHLETAAQSRANHIKTFLDKEKRLVLQLSKSVIIEKLLLADKTDEEYKNKLDDAITRLKNSVSVNNEIYDIFVLDANGIVVVSNIEARHDLDRSEDQYFIHGKESIYIQDIYSSKFSKEEKSLAVSAPISQKVTNNLIGVIVIRIGLNNLNNIMTDRTGLGETGEIYLVNSEAYMITPSRFKKDTFLKQKIDSINLKNCLMHTTKQHVAGEKTVSVFPNYRAEKVLGTHEYIPEMRWCLLAEIDAKEAFTPINKLKGVIISISIIVIMIVLLLSLTLSKTITNPIKKLVQAAKEFADGNFDHKINIKTKDELKLLGNTFNETGERLKKARTIEKEYSQKLEQEVDQRTKQIETKVEELEKFQRLTVNRELKMVELKKKIKEQEKKIKKSKKRKDE